MVAEDRREVGVPVRGREPATLVALVVSLAVCFGAAAIGSALTFPQLAGWYAGLEKPSFNPPNGVFGPVWSILYVLMAVAAWRVWRAGRRSGRPVAAALALFGLQLLLNVVWSATFFGLENPGLGLAVIVALFLAIVATMLAFRQHDRVGTWLLAPYLAWVAFATVLNAAIWWLN